MDLGHSLHPLPQLSFVAFNVIDIASTVSASRTNIMAMAVMMACLKVGFIYLPLSCSTVSGCICRVLGGLGLHQLSDL